MREFFIDSINKTVNFKFSYDNDIRGDIKNCGINVRFNKLDKTWIVPINRFSKENIKKVVKKYCFKKVDNNIGEDVDFSYKKTEVDFAYLKGLCDSLGFTYTPRDYQLESLGYALDKGNIINGDDVGLGKTFESIIYTETTSSFPCLTIVPASVKYNWKEKWSEIVGEKRSISVIESSKRHVNNWDADVVIINYDILAKKAGTGATQKFDELINIDWKMIIFDEAHFLKNNKSKRSIVSKKIVKKGDPKIQLLTGTAIMSKPSELWNLLVISKNDKKLDINWKYFVEKYCGAYRGKYGLVTSGATNILELNKLLRENCYIRREKRDVLKELPDVTKQVIKVKVDNKSKINRAKKDFISFIKSTKGEEAAEKAMEAEHLVALGALRKLSIEGKLKYIENYLKDWKEAGNGKLVVFGLHREPLDYLSEKFESMLIAGGVKSKRKQEIVNEWITNNDTFIFANMQSAGTGVDGFQKVCSNMLILELPWRPSDIDQTIGRIDRSGQELPPTVTFLLSDDSIDKEMWDMLIDKELVTSAVNKGIDVKKNNSGMRDVINRIVSN